MGYSKIVVGVDGSETAESALRYAAQLAQAEGAELVVVTATHGSDGKSDAALEKAAKDAAEVGVQAETRVEQGDPAEVLIQTVEKESADLLVVGNKGMTGVARFALGNVPNKVSHHAPCDLLIVRTT